MTQCYTHTQWGALCYNAFVNCIRGALIQLEQVAWVAQKYRTPWAAQQLRRALSRYDVAQQVFRRPFRIYICKGPAPQAEKSEVDDTLVFCRRKENIVSVKAQLDNPIIATQIPIGAKIRGCGTLMKILDFYKQELEEAPARQLYERWLFALLLRYFSPSLLEPAALLLLVVLTLKVTFVRLEDKPPPLQQAPPLALLPQIQPTAPNPA